MKHSIAVVLVLFFSSYSSALFTGDPQNTTALVGTQAFFNCSFENLTALPIWVDSRGQSYSSSSTGEVHFIQISSMEIALNVTATQDRDGVCYFCETTLVSGDRISSGSGCLTVAGPPGAPNVTQVDATLTSVTISWTEASSNPMYPVIGYEVVFNGSTTMVGLVTWYEITGLMSETNYTVQVQGRNAAGVGEQGSVVATTAVPTFPPAPVNVMTRVAFNDGVPSLRVSWEAPELTPQQPNITNYTVYYMIYGSNQNETVTGIEALSVVVPNVSAEEMYTVKVVAVNSAGSSPAAVASANITYLQGLSYAIGEGFNFTCNFAFGPDFSTLLCAITIDNERPVYAVVNNGTPPSATYTARDLAGGSHTVMAQAVNSSDLFPVESSSRFLEFTVPIDDADDNGAYFNGSLFVTQLLGLLAVVLIGVVY